MSPNLRGRGAGATTKDLFKQSRHELMARDATVLLTRPEAASQRFAKMLSDAAGFDVPVVISPLLRIETQSLPPRTVEQGIPVFTSVNGVHSWAASDLKARGPAFCVGPATQHAAAELGFDASTPGGSGTVEDLVQLLQSRAPEQGIVHIHGAHTRGDLVARTRALGITSRGVIGYDQPLQPLSDEAKRALEGKDTVVVPLFSPRTAAQFGKECPKGAQPIVIALSKAVAAPVRAVKIAAHPDAPSMIKAVLACL